MSKENKELQFSSTEASQHRQKKPYRKPVVTEWGSVFDLTRFGPFMGVEDFPKGTVGV